MARNTRKTTPKDDLDELEAELEGLEEIEDEDLEDEVEDDDEGVDLSSMTAAQLKAHAKSLGLKGTDKKNKAALIELIESAGAEDEDEDEEEDDDEDEAEVEEDEDEDDGLDEMTRAELKAHIKSEGLDVRVLKSDSDADIVAKIRAAGDDEEEDDEPAPAPKKAAAPKKTPAKGKQPGHLTRALPQGRLGANDVAEMAGTTALAVRNFLRSDKGQQWPKNPDLGRYSFTAKQAQAIAKAMGARPGAGPRGPRKAAAPAGKKGATTKRK